VWSNTTSVQLSKPSDATQSGTTRPRSQTSSTWTTDDRRRAAGLSQQQQQQCTLYFYVYMMLQDCPHVSRTKEDFYTVRCQVTDMKNLYVSRVLGFQCLMLSVTALRSIRRSLTPDALKALVQAFVHCRLDYCNSLLAGVADAFSQFRMRQLIWSLGPVGRITSPRYFKHYIGFQSDRECFSRLRC